MPERGEVTDLVVQALATELKASDSAVRSARSLRGELKMDSIAAVNVAFVIEDAYEVEIEINEDDEFDSVESIVAVVSRALEARRSEG
jgi:acyl carrier protein